jgi:adenylate kinase family enzyme
MDRVLVIGSPGAGKSTLARVLAEGLALPLVHLDAEYWRSGWLETPPEEWRARLQEIVAGERWVIDGNYGGSLPQRLARADTVVWLDYPTPLCLWRIVRRLARYRGNARPDMAAGCPERFNLEFLVYVATFRSVKRAGIVRSLAGFSGMVVRFARPRAADRWLARLGRVTPLG